MAVKVRNVSNEFSRSATVEGIEYTFGPQESKLIENDYYATSIASTSADLVIADPNVAIPEVRSDYWADIGNTDDAKNFRT